MVLHKITEKTEMKKKTRGFYGDKLAIDDSRWTFIALRMQAHSS